MLLILNHIVVIFNCCRDILYQNMLKNRNLVSWEELRVGMELNVINLAIYNCEGVTYREAITEAGRGD